MTQTKKVTLNPGESQEVAFSYTPLEAQTYFVIVDGLSGSFKAVAVATFKTWVYDAETFAPVYHALVSMGIFPDKTPVISSGYTNASGYWETNVPADTYRVTYSKSGYLDFDRKVDVYVGMPPLITYLPPTH